MASGPITWRNVQGPNPRDVMLPMAVASQTINNAFSGLRDTLDEHLTGVKDRSTDDALNALYSRYSSAKALEEDMASGRVHQMLASFANADQGKLREAAGALLNTLYDRATKASSLEEAQRKAMEAPIIDAFWAADVRGDEATKERLMRENPDVRWGSVLNEDRKQNEASAQAEANLNFTKTNTSAAQQGIDHKESEFNRKEAERVGMAEGHQFLTDALEAHRTDAAKAYKELGEVAQNLGLPVTPGGLPDLNRMDPAQKERLATVSRQLGITIPQSDTKVFEAAMAALPDSVTSEMAAKLREEFRPRWTSAPDAIGTDKDALDARAAAEQALHEAYVKNNFYANSPDNPYHPDQTIMDFANKTFPEDPDEAIEVTRAANTLLGQKFPDSQGNLRHPTKQEVLRAMSLLKNSNWGFGIVANPSINLKGRLAEIIKDPEYNRLYAEHLKMEGGSHADRRLDIFEALYGAGSRPFISF